MFPLPDADSACKDEVAPPTRAELSAHRDDDTRWLNRRPRRSYRIRRARAPEPLPSARGQRVWALVWRPERGVLGKIFLETPSSWQPPVTDPGCRRLWERLSAGLPTVHMEAAG
jgi:hypothetical protein